MTEEILCPKCGASNAISYQFCGSCGEVLQITCPACGNLVETTFKFCPSCGASIGWGTRLLRDIQSQLTRTEEVLYKMMAQYSSDIKSQIAETKEGLEGMVTRYSSEVKSQSALLNQAVSSIPQVAAEKRRRPLLQVPGKVGTGLVGLGLVVIVLSYTLLNLPNLAIVGVLVIVLGFLLQLISLFIKS